MNKDLKSKKRSIHLYNPKEEGIGSYDVHYINAYKNLKRFKNNLSKHEGRYAAWSHLSEAYQS